MAIYRSDQAQVTFQTEANPGAYVELATGVTAGTGTAVINGDHAAGAKTLTVDAVSTSNNLFTVLAGEHIQIGANLADNAEVREVVHVSATSITLNAPTAFPHDNDETIRVVTAITEESTDQYINLIPGVYETVDTPDPEMAIEGRYFLGTASKRNYFAAYSGQQTYTGSIGGFVLLNGKALRYPIGKVNTTTTYVNVADNGDNETPDWGGHVNGAVKAGSIHVPYNNYANNVNNATLADDTYLVFVGQTTVPSSTTFSFDTTEVRKVISTTGVNDNAGTMRLDYPLQFDHADNEVFLAVMTESGGTTVATTQTIPYTHAISETVDLDSVTWHVHMRDSGETDANDFDRRYFGGKIGSMTISAEEGGMVTSGWDSVNFLGMIHNQKSSSAPGTPSVPFYSPMQPIRSTEVQFPTTEPYYFSQGEVSLFGQPIARVRNFSLTITNNEEPRYYIKKQLGRNRGPAEIKENRREYSCTVTLALPDSAAFNTPARTVWNELLLEGNYGGVNSNRTGKTGFDITFTLTRGEIVAGGTEDKITITIPSSSAAAGGNSQGALIRTAPHNITEDNPFQVEADILFRSMKIDIQDAEHYYP